MVKTLRLCYKILSRDSDYYSDLLKFINFVNELFDASTDSIRMEINSGCYCLHETSHLARVDFDLGYSLFAVYTVYLSSSKFDNKVQEKLKLYMGGFVKHKKFDDY